MAGRRRTGDDGPAAAPRGAGPPWILGLRGAPLEAPENTLAGLRRALDVGLDGVEYDLRACASGELVLLRDETLGRTTDGRGYLREKTLPELFSLDAGGWFDKRFVGEQLPLFDEVLELDGDPGSEPPLHWIDLREPELLEPVALRLRQPAVPRAVRLATDSRELCLRVRDAGLPALLLARQANADDLEFVRRERIPAYAAAADGWRGEVAGEEWPCERWAFGVDEPRDLLDACRRPLFGFSTSAPQRALAVRQLARAAPHDEGPYPVDVPALLVHGEPSAEGATGGGDWRGNWSTSATVRNPFPFEVEVACQLFVRRGAFEVTGLPVRFELAARELAEVPFELSGGSWSPGGDPLLAALYQWRRGPGRPAGRLLLDAPLARVRTAVADGNTRRLRMLCESPGQPEATMTLRRRGRELHVAIENPGGLRQPQVLVHLEGSLRRGERGVRVALPPDFDRRTGGVPFSCGFEGLIGSGPAASTVLRRWAGGLPEGPGSGVPGVLVPRAGA